MKVYASPIKEPEVDYRNYDREVEAKKEKEHLAAVKDWLKANGYNGKRTGEVVRFHVADGYAQYMLADGKKSALIHLPYGDAYSYPDVRFLPSEILKRLDAEKRFAAMFEKAKKEKVG